MPIFTLPLAASIQAVTRPHKSRAQKISRFLDLLANRNLALETSEVRKTIALTAQSLGGHEDLSIRLIDYTDRLGSWLKDIPLAHEDDYISPVEEFGFIEALTSNLAINNSLEPPLLVWDPTVEPNYDNALYSQQLKEGTIKPRSVKPLAKGFSKTPANDLG